LYTLFLGFLVIETEKSLVGLNARTGVFVYDLEYDFEGIGLS